MLIFNAFNGNAIKLLTKMQIIFKLQILFSNYKDANYFNKDANYRIYYTNIIHENHPMVLVTVTSSWSRADPRRCNQPYFPHSDVRF